MDGLLVNRFGQGKAYLLNKFLDSYPKEKPEGKNGPALQQIGVVLKDAGLQPKIRLSSLNGDAVADCATYLFNNGSTRLLGLIPDRKMPRPQRVRLAFKESSAIYDVREKRYLGSASSFETGIEPAVPRLFAMVDTPITNMEAAGPRLL
jgi:hypothetical protein